MKKIYVWLILVLNFFLFTQEIYSENLNKNVKDNLNTQDYISHNDPYLIGPGDAVDIKFFGAQDFNNSFPVFSDGSINLPLVGKIIILNLSIEDAKYKIENLLKKELLQPEIYLSISKSRPIKVNLSGEINKPGIYTLDTSKVNNQERNSKESLHFPTIIDAINQAGGFNQNANLKKIEINRLISGDKMEYKKFTINLSEILDNKLQTFNLYLKDGDFIKVYKADKFDPNNIISLSKSNLMADKIRVNVIGEVKNPGELTLSPDTTLSQAVLSAGGLVNIKANKGNIKLFRINEDGSAFYKSFKMNFNNDISNKSNPILKNGDIVEVNTKVLASVGEGINTFINPFLMPLYFLR